MAWSTSSFFRLVEMDAAEAARYPDTFARIRRGELHAALVHNVYDADVLQDVAARLERHDPPFLQTWFPAEFRSWFFGRNLNLTHPELPGYFREADQFHQHLRDLFPPGRGITDYLAGLLAQLDHGRPFRAPPGPRTGEHYMFTTIRAHLEGGFIPPHCDNEQALRPSYRHLDTLVDAHMLSFVLALTLPEAGGALRIYDHCFDPRAGTLLNDDRVSHRPNLAELESASFRLPPGTMIVVDSGRYLHELTPVAGPRKRWAVCSFMALSRDGAAMYCWG